MLWIISVLATCFLFGCITEPKVREVDHQMDCELVVDSVTYDSTWRTAEHQSCVYTPK